MRSVLLFFVLRARIKHSAQQLHVFCASFTMSSVPVYTIGMKWVVSADGPQQQDHTDWVPSVCNVPDHEGPFVTHSRYGDRGLARALGWNCNQVWQMVGVQTFSLIARIRDMEVDRHIAEYRRRADPMADNVANSPVGPRLCDRLTACPAFLTITLPAVTLEDGVELDPLDIIVQSSARRGVCVPLCI